MLSPEVQKRLEAARKAEADYQPNAKTSAAINDKSLVMIVGPAATGKSFIMNHIVQANATFARIPVFTTRPPRSDDDPGMFRTHPNTDASVSEILDQIEAREVVQYAIHPTSGCIYGSTTDDFKADFNLLATLSGTVERLHRLPFKSTYSIGLAAPPEAWLTWFNQRYPHKNEERAKRAREAISSLEWLLAPEHRAIVRWVDNDAKNVQNTIQNIVNIVKYNDQGHPGAAAHARQMLQVAKRYL